MGQSLDAKVFYGYSWSEEGEGPFTVPYDERSYEDDDDDEREWDDVLVHNWIAANPGTDVVYPYGDAYVEGDDEGHRRRYDAWKAKQTELTAPFEGIDTGSHGNLMYLGQPHVYFKTKGAYVDAYYGAEVIDFTALQAALPDDADQRLAAWIEATGARVDNSDHPDGPTWFVAPYLS
jgi:hypothetical protein